jgi:dTDP-4-amino-4,6-dideoxygalactose transaminase
MWRVPYIDLVAQYRQLHNEIDPAVRRVLASGRYVNGPETERFEHDMARYLGVKHVVAVGSGYDALFLTLSEMPLPPASFVTTSHYTHHSTHNAIRNAGHIISYVENGIGDRTAAIVPIHMNGRVCHVPVPEGVLVIEDACQAIGAQYKGRKAGTIGFAGCFSVHPLKILGAGGDGGFVATSDTGLSDRIRSRRNHGGLNGVNSRLDEIQAAILRVKLPYLDEWINDRQNIARIYDHELPGWVQKPTPPDDGDYFDTYSSYVIGGSPELLAHMRKEGIECYSHIRPDKLSLPIYQGMPAWAMEQVIGAVRNYAQN